MKSIRKAYKNRKFFFKNKQQQKKDNDSEDTEEQQQLDQNEEIPEKYRLNLAERLNSKDEQIRELGVISLVNISLTTHVNVLKEILNEEVLSTIVKGFQDPSPNLIIHNINACMNLINVEQYQREIGNEIAFSQFFIEKGLLATLEQLITEVYQILEKPTTIGKQRYEGFKIIVACFYLLSTLCEVLPEKELKLVTETPIGSTYLGLGLKVLNYQPNQLQSQYETTQSQQQLTQDLELVKENVIGVLNFFQVFSECSGPALAQKLLLDQNMTQILFKIGESNASDCSPQLAISTLMNLMFASLFEQDQSILQNQEFTAFMEKVYQILENSVQKCLSIEIHEELNTLRNIISNQLQDNNGQGEEEKKQEGDEMLQDQELEMEFDQDLSNSDINGKPKNHQKLVNNLTKKSRGALKIWLDTSEQIQTLTTIILNLFESDDFEDEEDFLEDEQEQKKPSKSNKETANSPVTVDQTIKKQIVQKLFEKGVIQYLIEKTQMMTPENLEFYQKINRDIITEIQRVEDYSISCLLNFVETFFDDFYNESTHQFWQDIQKQIWEKFLARISNLHLSSTEKELQSNDLVFQSINNEKLILSMLMKNKSLSMALPAQDFDTFFTWFKNQSANITKHNQEVVLVFLDICGQRFHPLNKNSNAEENLYMTKVLIELMQSSKNPIISAQALSILYDVQSEEMYDNNFVSLNLLPILQQGLEMYQQQLPNFKQTYSKSQYAFLQQTFTNLKRFIQYKQEHIK